MKTTGLFTRENFLFGRLRQLFIQKQIKEKSESIDKLLQEISTPQYQKKINLMVKQDLLLRYTPETVNFCLEILDFDLVTKTQANSEAVKQAEPVPVQPPVQRTRSNEILTEEKKQEIYKIEARVPKWFNNPHQINSQILISYMNLLGETNSVPVQKLESACRS